MKNVSDKQMATEILELLGGKENVLSHTNCMTRLRVTVKDNELVNAEKLESLPYVIKYQLVSGVHQVVIGVGVVNRVRSEFDKLTDSKGTEEVDENIDVREKSIFGRFISMMQATMMPLIGAIIAAALISAVVNIFAIFGITTETNELVNAMKLFSTVGISAIGAMAAFNLAKYLGGNPYLALLFGVFLYSEVSITNVTVFGTNLTTGIGGIIGIFLMTATLCFVEKKITKLIPDSLKLVIVPLVVAIITLIVTLYVIVPISGVLTTFLVKMFNLFVNGSTLVYIIGCIVLAASYPLLVMSGLHMALFIIIMPIFIETGYMPLIAAAFLGGAAQLGTATAVFIKEKNNTQIREIYLAGAPSAILGVIEPLMYGINVPKLKPLIAALIAAGCGGFAIGITGLQMNYGLAGLIGMVSFDTVPQMLTYGAIWIGTSVIGFIICSIIYKSELKEDGL